jgi:hypothetical protein
MRTIGSRLLWIVLAVILVVTGAVVVSLSEPDLVPVTDPAGEVTIVGELSIDQDGVVPDTVTARVRPTGSTACASAVTTTW